MPIEPASPKQRELLQRLIRDAFARHAPQRPRLSAREAFDTIHRHGTQLPGVSADQVRKLRREQVREELFAMSDEVRVHEANTPRERFSLLRA